MTAYRPVRVQRRRTAGWRTPLCGCGCGLPARYVGRGTRWGNPYKAVKYQSRWAVINLNWAPSDALEIADSHLMANLIAVNMFRERFTDDLLEQAEAKIELGGHDLMCWCSPNLPCHADVLLHAANHQLKLAASRRSA